MPAQFEQSEDAAVSSEVTAQHLASLIFLSYRFSQGGIGTQNRMLLYLEKHFHPNLMAGENSAEIRERTNRMVGRYFLNQQLHPATAIPWEDDSPEAARKTDRLVVNELSGLFGRFEDRGEIASFTDDIAGIAQSVIVMDADYLGRPRGRAGDSMALKIKVDPYPRDPYDSLYMKYAVLGRSTNTIEYDAIFGQLAQDDVIGQFDDHTRRQLQFVASVYETHHPEIAEDPRISRIRNLTAEV